MISYEIKDLIKAVIKKWYIILVFMILGGALAVPISQQSYERAYNQYQIRIEEQKLAEEQQIQKAQQEIEQLKKSALSYGYARIRIDVGENMDSSIVGTVKQEVINLLLSPGFRNLVINDMQSQYPSATIDLFNAIEMKELYNSKDIVIIYNNINKALFEAFLETITANSE